jgi:DNA replication protein DnaD
VNNCYGKVEQFALSLYKINTVLAKEDDKKPDIHTIVLPEYHNYLKIFKRANANKLPLYCPSDHTMLLIDRFKPPFGPFHLLSYPELEELKYWLDEKLSKGFIHTVLSPTAAPILFVKKGDSSL